MTEEEQSKREMQEELFAANYSLAAFTVKKVCGGFDEDMHQEACMALWKATEKYDPNRGKFSTFAVKTIRNHLLSKIRDGKTKGRDGSDNISIYSRRGDDKVLLDMLGEEDAHADLDGLKAILSRQERKVLELRQKGMKYREIAKKLNTSTAAISNAVTRIREKARDYI